MKPGIIIGIIGLLCVMIISCQSEEQVEFKRYYTAGEVIYQQKCQNCHGKNGEGLGALIPPLTDSTYLKKNSGLLACIVKNGLEGKVMINKTPYNSNMPGNDLPPVEVAKVVTYITNSFGNKAGTRTAEQADADLQKCR